MNFHVMKFFLLKLLDYCRDKFLFSSEHFFPPLLTNLLAISEFITLQLAPESTIMLIGTLFTFTIICNIITTSFVLRTLLTIVHLTSTVSSKMSKFPTNIIFVFTL